MAVLLAEYRVPNYFRFEQGLWGTGFLLWGVCIKKSRLKSNNMVGILGLAAGGIIALLNGEVIISRMQFGNSTVLSCVSAVATIVGIRWMCEKWSDSNILIFLRNYFDEIGKNTMIILCTHQLLLYGLGSILGRLLSGTSLKVSEFVNTMFIYMCVFKGNKKLRKMINR